jgi:formate hydrogenlyase subunit 6/NADH:ubiquinone oxidoreductase subunit I
MASCCGPKSCGCSSGTDEETYVAASVRNTLSFNAARCIGCGMCAMVCPHGVFRLDRDNDVRGRVTVRTVSLVHPDACMECGACQINCPTAALRVDTGVGCAAAMIHAALTGQKEPTCGCC